MLFDQMLDNLLTIGPMILFKAAAIILLLLHLAFSFVLVRQTKLMNKVVEANISSSIYHVAVLHFLVSTAVFIWAALFL